MSYKRFIFYFFLYPFLLIGTLFSLNCVIDPLGITDHNLLNIKYKFARDDRVEKVERIKKIPQIDNLILGSSRSQHIDPKILGEYFGGVSYNFGVGGGNTADALGILLYLQKSHKLPKHTLLTLDFSTFFGDALHPTFYKLPELNFYDSNMKEPSQVAKLLSIDAVRASFKTLKAHIKGTIPNTYFDESGFMVSRVIKEIDPKIIDEQSHTYVNNIYANNGSNISDERLRNLAAIVDLCRQNGIDLRVTLTPLFFTQYELIQKNTLLARNLELFKERLAAITPFYDAMVVNEYIKEYGYFEENVHTNEKYGKLYLEAIYKSMHTGLVTLRVRELLSPL
ncbi:MAG: hypothetical protein IE916_10565 [Epsilonproteobacteria bacterium]|nr:hypothetical protein [Campylobacterota bacterium]